MASGLTVVVFVLNERMGVRFLSPEAYFRGVSSSDPSEGILLSSSGVAETTVCRVVWTPFPKFQYLLLLRSGVAEWENRSFAVLGR